MRADSHTTPTSHYLGVCAPCVRPTRTTITGMGRYAYATCGQCGHTITVERLHAVTTEETCNTMCMGATGPSCSCACGGENHGGNYSVTVTEETESAVEAFRARVAKQEAKKAAATERAMARRQNAFSEWMNDDEDAARLVELLRANVSWGDRNEFLASLLQQIDSCKILSDRQVQAGLNTANRIAERERSVAEFKQNATLAPEGTVTIAGEIEYVKNDHYGPRITVKMLVNTGTFKVWATVPQVLFQDADGMVRGGCADRLKGRVVEFTATVTRSDRDGSVGFAKRPRNARFVI